MNVTSEPSPFVETISELEPMRSDEAMCTTELVSDEEAMCTSTEPILCVEAAATSNGLTTMAPAMAGVLAVLGAFLCVRRVKRLLGEALMYPTARRKVT